MAVRPRALYPSQTRSDDPGYPYGKAQNVSVAGDATGTPLEEDWLNDLFGWQQALLFEAGILPSNIPDRVSASQYLDAMKVVMGARIAALLAADSTWTGEHTFNEEIRALGGLRIFGTPVFDTPPIARIIMPLRSAQPGLVSNSMYFYASGREIFVHGDGTNSMSVRFPIKVPHGSVVTAARVGLKPNASDASVSIKRLTPDKTPAAGAVDTLLLTAPATVAGGAGGTVAEAILVSSVTIDNISSEYWVEVDVGMSSAAMAEIYFCDVRTVFPALSPY